MLAPVLLNEEQKRRREKVLKWFTDYREAEDLINIGAYEKGSNPEIDEAIEMTTKLRNLFKQDMNEFFSLSQTEQELSSIIGER